MHDGAREMHRRRAPKLCDHGDIHNLSADMRTPPRIRVEIDNQHQVFEVLLWVLLARAECDHTFQGPIKQRFMARSLWNLMRRH